MNSFGYAVASWGLAGFVVALAGVFLFLGRSIDRTLVVVQIPVCANVLLVPFAGPMATWGLYATAGGRTLPMVRGIESGVAACVVTALAAYLVSPSAMGKCHPLTGNAGGVVNLALVLATTIGVQRIVASDPIALRRLLYAGLEGVPSEDTFCLVLTVAVVVSLLAKMFLGNLVAALRCRDGCGGTVVPRDRWGALVLVMCAVTVAAAVPVTGALFVIALTVVPVYLAARWCSSTGRMLVVAGILGMAFALSGVTGQYLVGIPGGLFGTTVAAFALFVLPERVPS